MDNENKEVTVSIGDSTNLGKSKNTKGSWKKLKARFAKPVVTPETFAQYLNKSDKQQAALKVVGGWYIKCEVKEGTRRRDHILPSDLITLDFDDCDPQFFEDLLEGRILPGYELFAHTSRKHTPEKPRLRIIIPLTGKVDKDRYGAASRIIAEMIDPEMEHVDKVSFRPAQMMYFPTVSSDMAKHYTTYEQPGKLASHEKAIARWEKNNQKDASDIAALPTTPDEGKLRISAESMEDPLTKKGIVGIFCRAYTIQELVEGTGAPSLRAAPDHTGAPWLHNPFHSPRWVPQTHHVKEDPQQGQSDGAGRRASGGPAARGQYGQRRDQTPTAA